MKTSFVILYFCLACICQIFSQNTGANIPHNAVGTSIKSLESINSGDYYLVKIHTDSISYLHQLDSVNIIKRVSNSSYIVFYDFFQQFGKNHLQNDFSVYQISNLWKSADTAKINLNTLLDGTYFVQVTDEELLKAYVQSTSKINAIKLQDDIFKLTIANTWGSSLLSNSFITYIEKASDLEKSKVRVLDLNLHPNRINTIQAYRTNLDGTEELVSVREPFYTIDDIDIMGRYSNTGRESSFVDNHALEMVTIIAGNGNTSLNGLGVAPKSLHTSSSNAEILPDPISYFKSNGIQTQNHSYGTEIESFYGVGASLYDQQVNESPEILHVFSAGNSGLESADHGKYQGLTGFANITGNFKLAKNVLTIGAVDTLMNTIVFNSNGPAFDGRIKPELVAYSMAGTSNSAAYVSGVSVLLQESFRKKFGADMSSDLVKAFLINGADDIGSLGPDHKTGYGSLNAYESITQLEEEKFMQGDLLNDLQKKYKLAVPENAVNFKATLVWIDPAATTNDQIALINDLNIEIVDGNGQNHLPWVLSTEPNIESLSSAAVKGVDHLNNIEQVYIEQVDSDSLEIVITTKSPLQSSQSFSIVYDWEIKDEFSWTSPTFKDNIPYNGETVSHLRWESSYLGDQKGDLYFKLIDESDWNIIAEDISLNQENFRWDPEMVNDFALLKMEIGDNSYVSDTFSISEPLRLNVGFNCTDSLSFYWKEIDNADYYILSNLQGNVMNSFLSTQDTSITIKKSDLSSPFLKVQAFKNNRPLIQGSAIDYTLQASNCFLQSYFVEAVQKEGIYHNIRLSDFSGVDKIQVQKRNGMESDWDLLAEINANSFNLEFLEEQPINGFNKSRVLLFLNNGQNVVSEIQSTYFVKDANYILYPNPIIIEEDLKVFAKEAKTNAKITFYTMQGLELNSFSLPNDRNFLDLSSFREGLYIYRISDKGSQYAQGKILIRK